MPDINTVRNQYLALKYRNGPEKALLNSWLWKEHQTSIQWRNVRLGPLPTKELARAYNVLMRFADAVYLEDGTVFIVEAKIRPGPGAIGQLELYLQLFKETPEFSAYKLWPIKLVLLTSILDLQMAEFASKKDIKLVIFNENDVNKVRSELMLPLVTFEEQ